MSYITNGIQLAGGAAMTAFGNPMGIGMMANGASGLAGGASGGSGGGGASSGGLGGILSMLGGGGGPTTSSGGFAAPGTSGTPSLESIQGQLPSWLQNVPGSNSGPPIAGISTDTGTMNAPPQPTNWLGALGSGIGTLGSAASTAMSAMPKSQGSQSQVSAAPAFRASGGGSPGFAQTINGGGFQPSMRTPITPPTFRSANSNSGPNYQLLRALGFSG